MFDMEKNEILKPDPQGSESKKISLGEVIRKIFIDDDKKARRKALENLRTNILRERHDFKVHNESTPQEKYPDENIMHIMQVLLTAGKDFANPDELYFCEGNPVKNPAMAVKEKMFDGKKRLLVSFNNYHLGAGVSVLFTESAEPQMNILLTDPAHNETYPAIYAQTYDAMSAVISSFAKLKPKNLIYRNRMIGVNPAEMRKIN